MQLPSRLTVVVCRPRLLSVCGVLVLLQSTTRVKPMICTMPMRLDAVGGGAADASDR